MAKKICRHCGKEFESSALPKDNRCQYHPQKAEHMGTSDVHHDYSDVYKYPCCGQVEFPQYLTGESAPGCIVSVHEE